jgi:Protein of unknown function (DUF616)
MGAALGPSTPNPGAQGQRCSAMAERSPILSSGSSSHRDTSVVYTAISGGYDRLREQPAAATAGAAFVAFLDAPVVSRTWARRPLHMEFDEPARNAKIHKILPHRFFPDTEYSLWLDGSITARFSCSIRRLADTFLGEHDIAVFQHSRRTCAYQEGNVCFQFGLDEPARVWEQVCRYTHEAFPANAGLAECPVVLRRHTPAIRAFNEAWWDEIVRGSRRDQISFPYIAWKLGLRYATFPGTIENNAFFTQNGHASVVRRHTARLVKSAIRYGSWVSGRAHVVGLRARSRLLGTCEGAPPSREPTRPPVPAGASADTGPSPLVQRVEREFRRGSRGGLRALVAGHLPIQPPIIRGSSGLLRRTVGLGPARPMPSWDWVGFDTARALSRYYDVVLFDSWATRPTCDVVVIVKEPPPPAVLAELRGGAARLVYCPVDVYRSSEALEGDANLLNACDMVLVHSERLLRLVEPHCRVVHFVEHHLRYALPTRTEYRADGYLLWIGGFQYVPYLLRWLQDHPLPLELRILSDVDNHRARDRAHVLAAEIGTRFTISPDGPSVAGHRIETWSERRQAEMMRECRAALDIKATDRFNQYYKPPAKAQQFVASGVPFAVNGESYSAEYFRARGFDVASPLDPDRWLSPSYWEQSCEWSEQWRAGLSLEAVAARYRDLLETLWAGG